MTDSAAFSIAAVVSAWLEAPLWVTVVFAAAAVLAAIGGWAKS
jgi:hypothetical protein